MVSSTEAILILRPVGDVYGFTIDLRSEPSWDIDLDAAPDEADVHLEVGEEHIVRFAPFLGETEGTLTAVEMLPGVRVVLRGDFAGMDWVITYLYAAEDAGTRFTRRVEVQPEGILRLLLPLLASRVRRHNRQDVVNLKRILEAS